MVAERRIWRNLVHGHFKRWLAAIVGIELHAKPDCVATTGFHNKVSTVPESPWPEVYVEQKFKIQIQIFNRFFCNHFCINFRAHNVVRKHFKFQIIYKIETPRCRLHSSKQHTKKRISQARFIIERLLSRRAAAQFLKLSREKLDNANFLPTLPHPKSGCCEPAAGARCAGGRCGGVEFGA